MSDAAGAVSGLTGRLAAHASALEVADLPLPVQEQGRRLFTDTVGVLLAASQTAPLRLLATTDAMFDDGGRSTVIGHGRDYSLDRAAFVNGVAGHHIELDDSHSPSQTHPGSVLVPATLAVAERCGASGADVLAGFVAGYDVIGRFCSAARVQAIYDRGFHPTSVAGALGAAAAAGRVLRLDEQAMSYALGLAASQSSGLLTWEDDESHQAKSFQTGVAARNGVHAALVASAGYRGALDALGGRYNAVAAFGGEQGDPSRLVLELGERFDIMVTELKRHASCRQTHAAIDAVRLLIDETGITADQIESMEIELSTASTQWVGGNPLWTHNVEYVTSLAAYTGHVLPENFEARWTEDPDIRSLKSRTTVRGNTEFDAAFPAAKGAIVRVHTAGGTEERRLPYPVGHPSNPLTDAQLRAKFDDLAASVLSPERSTLLHQSLDRLEQLDSMTPVLDLLVPDPAYDERS
ncbi:MAG: MmgE/PrpD family protein [Nocardioides sp.]